MRATNYDTVGTDPGRDISHLGLVFGDVLLS